MKEEPSLIQSLTKSLIREVTKAAINGEESMSHDLMRQCLNEDYTAFTGEDLDALGPEYRRELEDMVKTAMVQESKNHLGNHVVSLGHVYTGKERAEERRFEQPQQGDTVNPYFKDIESVFNSETNHTLNPQEQHRQDVRKDIARALSHVEIHVTEDGVTVIDEFDFANPSHKATQEVGDDNVSLAKFAIKNHFGNNEPLRNVALGRMFCKEGEYDRPESSYVPVEIHLDISLDGVKDIELAQNNIPNAKKGDDTPSI